MRRLFLLIVLVSIVLLGCIGGGGKNVTPEQLPNVTNKTNISIEVPVTVNVTNVTKCENVTVGREQCFIDRAVNTSDFSDCQKLNGSWFENCTMELAKKDWTLCAYLNEGSKMDSCFVSIAGIFGETICDKIIGTNAKEECKLAFVSEKCRSITNETDRYTCDAVAKDNESICAKAPSTESCYLKFSQQKRNVCSKIEREAVRIGCMATVMNNPVLCDGLTGVSKDLCYQTVAVETTSCSLCAKCVTDSYKDDCYTQCSLGSKDVTMCVYPSTEQKRDSCYYNFALTNSAPEVCDQIKFLAQRAVCVDNVAMEAVEPYYCERLSTLSGTYVVDCYNKVIALQTITYEKCMRMGATYSRDQCVLNVVKITKNKDICSSILDEALRNYCSTLQ